MGRAPCCEKVGLNRGRWTTEEDEKLTNYIQQNGEGSWRSLPKNAGLLRCGKSCRLRWINYLRSDLKRGNITPEEEDLIIKLHATMGNRWSAIAGKLPGRTDNEIKNYWNSHLSRKIHTFRSPNGKENVINLSNVIAPPKRRGGRTSRATMQRNRINQALNHKNNVDIKDVGPLPNNTNDIIRTNINTNNVNATVPHLGPIEIMGDQNVMFANQESELLGIEDIMDLDGLLGAPSDVPLGPSENGGPSSISEDQGQSNSSVTCNVSSSGGSNNGGSPASSSSYFDGGLDWDREIGMVDGVGQDLQLCSEKDHIISWLWENDEKDLQEPIFSDLAADVDSEQQQAWMLTWLLS